MADIAKFIPKAERLKAEQVAEVRQYVLGLGLPGRATEDILITLQRHETGGILADWTFNMISPAQCLAVWNAINEGEKPNETRRIFDYVLTHIETNTGLVTLTRDELADIVGIAPKHVSSAMKRLEDLGAIVRERVKVPGMRGPGKARYRLNPHVGWNGKLESRKLAAEQVPLPFDVIEGGKNA
jgi:DNA-binding transcriptional ArsR family regulator